MPGGDENAWKNAWKELQLYYRNDDAESYREVVII
jgi:hypothetical protein